MSIILIVQNRDGGTALRSGGGGVLISDSTMALWGAESTFSYYFFIICTPKALQKSWILKRYNKHPPFTIIIVNIFILDFIVILIIIINNNNNNNNSKLNYQRFQLFYSKKEQDYVKWYSG